MKNKKKRSTLKEFTFENIKNRSKYPSKKRQTNNPAKKLFYQIFLVISVLSVFVGVGVSFAGEAAKLSSLLASLSSSWSLRNVTLLEVRIYKS